MILETSLTRYYEHQDDVR